jgi:hypothetical protein
MHVGIAQQQHRHRSILRAAEPCVKRPWGPQFRAEQEATTGTLEREKLAAAFAHVFDAYSGPGQSIYRA